jgi:hypothetical protein
MYNLAPPVRSSGFGMKGCNFDELSYYLVNNEQDHSASID